MLKNAFIYLDDETKVDCVYAAAMVLDTIKYTFICLTIFLYSLMICVKKRHRIQKSEIKNTYNTDTNTTFIEKTCEDSFKAHAPKQQVAKRANEIVLKGPVSRYRNDYRTMNMSTIDFDQSMSKG